MTRQAVFLFAVATLAAPLLLAGDFCRGGLHADGVIDWSAATTATNPQGTTIMAPVRGIAGLVATLTTTSAPPPFISDPNTLAIYGSSTMTFDHPVKGVSARLRGLTRDPYTFTLTAHRTGADAFSDYGQGSASNSSANGALSFKNVFADLTLVSPATDITSVDLPPQVYPGDFYYINNFRVQSDDVNLSAAVPKTGLQMWLADKFTIGTFSIGSGIATIPQWTDLSGQGNHATQTNVAQQPTAYVAFTDSNQTPAGEGPTCQQLIHFRGGQFFNFRLPIDGLSEITIFLVSGANADGDGGQPGSESAAIFWNESQTWGSSHLSPYQTDISARFGTTQANTNIIYKRPVDIGGDLTVTTFQKSGSTESLWVNARQVFQQSGKPHLDGVRDDGFLGLGYNNTPWIGAIGEVLVYNRALSSSERAAVERYLMSKHLDLRE
jgi:hypothetical protein